MYKREKDEEKGKKTEENNIMNKMAVNICLTIITLSVNGLNAPTKRHRVAEWIRKQYLYICCFQGTHLRSKDTHRLKVKG